MAQLVPKLLFQGNNQAGSVYTTPSNAEAYTIIKSINVCNTSSAPHTFSIYLITDGGSATAANTIVGEINMAANVVFVYETSIVMPSSSSIYISQDTTDLTFTISGVENVV